MNIKKLFKSVCSSLLSAKKSIFVIIFMGALISGITAQEVVYDIISITGKIIDKRNGAELQVGDKVSFQTDIEFSSMQDRAVLLSPEKSKYFLELPKSSFVNSQLTVNSTLALAPVKGRPALSYDTRGSSVLTTKGLSPESLKEYFSLDTFTVIGDKFVLPVKKQEMKKYSLVFRYENGGNVKDIIANNFAISSKDLEIQGNTLPECFVILKDGEKTYPITKLSLFFVDKTKLFGEFDSLIKALNKNKSDKTEMREILKQYCTDVYGLIDGNTLDATINEYLGTKI